MWYYLKFSVAFFLLCFFVLPFFNIEDPFRTIALKYFYQESDARIVEHICKPDRTYWYEYQAHEIQYRQRYDGYVEELDNRIAPDRRCMGILNESVPIKIKYFPYFSYWSEPVESIQSKPIIVLMYILVKIGAIFILLWTFLRRWSHYRFHYLWSELFGQI